ncbi:MAG: hypothetical protein KDK76_03785 [Chlamydiia bacterium]|nr:hypothetical protein [Chlamydiia bacterium]
MEKTGNNIKSVFCILDFSSCVEESDKKDDQADQIAQDFFANASATSSFQPVNVTSTLSLSQVREGVNKRLSDILRMIRGMNFSRKYENEHLRSPTQEEFAPFVDAVIAFRKEFRSDSEKLSFEEGLQVNEIYNGAMTQLVKAIAKKIQSDALYSRAIEQDRVKNNLLNPKKNFSKNAYLAVIQEHIEALAVHHPISQPLLEFRDLLNIQRFPEAKREPNTEETCALKILLDFFEHQMRPQGYL